jgi:DNA-binding FadR family transcriptional regulator
MSTSPPQRRTPYERIKARVLEHDFRPGQFLRVAQLAEELTVSATPIREALVRLASEGLLIEVHGRGYFVSRLTESDLRDLYRLVQLYLQTALATEPGSAAALRAADWPGGTLIEAAGGEGVVEKTACFFSALVEHWANSEMSRSLDHINDRLTPVRRCERFVLPSVERELQEMQALAGERRWGELGERIGAYHQRRLASASSIIFQLERRP